METIGDLFSKINIEGLLSKITFDPLAIISVLFTVGSAIWLSKSEKNFMLNKERHDKLIAPLFFALEPHLYRKAEGYIIDKAVLITDRNRNLADGKLLALLYDCKESPSPKSFIELCSYIDKEYDNSCRRLHLKRRPYSYRVDRRQYRNKRSLVLNTIKYSFFYIILFCIAIIAFMASFSILGKVLGLDNTTKQLVVYIASYLVLIAVLRYFDKNF